MDEQALNEKLAKWAGLPRTKWFTRSLNACFQWLVPKLRSVEIATFFAPEGHTNTWRVHVSTGTDYKDVFYGDTPALALCLAIEKLIDAENSNISSEKGAR